jgi:hypothetical protein
MQLLRSESAVLLDLSLWISDLQHLHGRQPVGVHVQWGELAVPRLRCPETVLGNLLRSHGIS